MAGELASTMAAAMKRLRAKEITGRAQARGT
jgi:hypothetical protein